jgi:hypothetical protein
MVQVSQMHVWLTSVLRVYVNVACVDEGLVLLPDTLARYLSYCHVQLVFGSPVRSSLPDPRGVDRDQDWSSKFRKQPKTGSVRSLLGLFRSLNRLRLRLVETESRPIFDIFTALSDCNGIV